MSARKNPSAVALGKLAAGKPKNFTPEEIELRKQRLAAGRSKRWQKKATQPEE